MKTVRWTLHALENLADREIDREEAEKTVNGPALTVAGHGNRTVFLRKYHDRVLGQEMLLCVVAEQHGDEVVVVTVYKTSKIEKYLGGGVS